MQGCLTRETIFEIATNSSNNLKVEVIFFNLRLVSQFLKYF